MNRFEIEVEEVFGYCSCGYKVGDKFYADGLNTPDNGFCGGAYMVLFPMQTALNCGAQFNFEDNPKSKTKISCPDNGFIHFKITMLEK